MLEQFEPDIVFLDVRMPGMDGFQLLEALGPKRPPGIVFVTAHDEHALRAFRVEAVDYLLKPFDEVRFREALERARRAVLEKRAREGAGKATPGVGRLLRAFRKALAEERPRRKVPLTLDRVVRIQADRNEAVFHAEGGEYRLRTTLKALEERLDPHRFVRINRSEIVNLERVLELEPLSHRYRDRMERFR